MRLVNFCAGPCTLPLPVLKEAQAEFVDYHGEGMSLFEMSHRGPVYREVHDRALTLVKQVFGTPDGWEALFVQGGATLQFALVPLNLLGRGASAGYLESGVWGKKALADASHHGDVYAAWEGAAFDFRRMPAPDEIRVRPGTRYLHVTSNETIGGIRLVQFPDLGVPLVADMSSDFLSRAIPWDLFDLVYGGVQKNLAPAGMAVVFVRRSVLEDTNRDLASYLRYDVHAAADSLANTPPVFSIYMMGKVLTWMLDQGGLAAVEKLAEEKAALLYQAIDHSDGFYLSPVDPASRSLMNVVFRLADEEREQAFLSAAEQAGLVNLKGHRSVGGIRASMYNAMPRSGVEALVEFMSDFRRG